MTLSSKILSTLPSICVGFLLRLTFLMIVSRLPAVSGTTCFLFPSSQEEKERAISFYNGGGRKMGRPELSFHWTTLVHMPTPKPVTMPREMLCTDCPSMWQRNGIPWLAQINQASLLELGWGQSHPKIIAIARWGRGRMDVGYPTLISNTTSFLKFTLPRYPPSMGLKA